MRPTDPRERSFRTEAIAHRGLSARAPENTLSAFELAVRHGADRVELDVLLTRDAIPVVIHDALLDRTTDARGPVCERSFEEIRRLDAGSWFHPSFAGERVPSLDEVLALCRGRAPVNVEIKEEAVEKRGDPGPSSVERQVVQLLERHGLARSAAVSSFEPLALERVGALDARIRRETLHDRAGRPPGAEDLEEALKTGSASLNVSFDELRAAQGIVEEARSRGLGIKVYTVDDPEEWPRLLDLGVAGIFTNRVDELAALIGRRPGSSPGSSRL